MKTVIAISGPTGVGKTTVAISLAKLFRTEIVSCDSRQFYKEMSIGVARPSQDELSEVPHHFISFLSAEEEYTAGRFSRDARDLITRLFHSTEVVVAVGGSMLYMDALLYGLDEMPKDLLVRERLNERCSQEGLASLVQELKEKDSEYANQVDLDNAHRVIRALEVIEITGKPYSELRLQSGDPIDAKIVHVFLSGEREWVYERINTRVDVMVENGLFEEVRSLESLRNLQALNTVGYKEIFEYFDGAISREEAIQEIKKNTRNYAKRQMTWYRNKRHVISIDIQRENPIQVISGLVSA